METLNVKPLLAFSQDEDGAVTVDWVVLTAAIVGLGIVALAPITQGTESMSDKTSGYIDSVNVGFMSE